MYSCSTLAAQARVEAGGSSGGKARAAAGANPPPGLIAVDLHGTLRRRCCPRGCCACAEQAGCVARWQAETCTLEAIAPRNEMPGVYKWRA